MAYTTRSSGTWRDRRTISSIDRHVLNAYWQLEKGLADGACQGAKRELYDEYRVFFFRAYETVFGTDERKNDLETVRNMKILDNALFEYDKAQGKK
ncbi:MAG: hypothetical protein K2N31_05525 [Treponemataceae bacterium]|nr:hypothetical protein [Treponemataceae bacterium]